MWGRCNDAPRIKPRGARQVWLNTSGIRNSKTASSWCQRQRAISHSCRNRHDRADMSGDWGTAVWLPCSDHPESGAAIARRNDRHHRRFARFVEVGDLSFLPSSCSSRMFPLLAFAFASDTTRLPRRGTLDSRR